MIFFSQNLLYIDWFRWFANALDLILIFIAVYATLRFFRRRRATEIAVGLISFSLVCWFVQRYWPTNLAGLFREILVYLPILALLAFLTEIKQAFTRVGQSLLMATRRLSTLDGWVVDEIALAATTFAQNKTGALIVIERNVELGQIIAGGVEIDATVSYDLLLSIFNTGGPLHDGAAIIRGGRIAATSCFGPLSVNPLTSEELGSRHRAAIGFTEDTDAVAVVVSEETGVISFTQEGQIRRGLNAMKLREALLTAFGEVNTRHALTITIDGRQSRARDRRA